VPLNWLRDRGEGRRDVEEGDFRWGKGGGGGVGGCHFVPGIAKYSVGINIICN
jgi:hypothetical protein